ncbi:LOW QUALITY PROTEIN: sirtuin 7 [Choristoneura fumiferana]|uniref:LOW QUALITY PROTEIN: sirtuin 7 n=1 Tax=Choristoneura fumiferana TaxID=7141 RepID=UPI003D155113
MERAVRSSTRLSGGAGPAPSPSPSPAAAEAAAAAARRAAAAVAAERRARAAQRALEVEDSPAELRRKCRLLARAVRSARHLVVYTGAGISTAADIPDYRGPLGVWTRLRRGERVARVSPARARPTYTHMALAALVARGLARFVVSQNCDGLHARAGLPRRALAELHGDMFAERCPAPRCRTVLLRAFDTTTRTRRHAHGTRRTCPAPRCGRPLRDTIVHFGERARAAWPHHWAGALRHAAAADVVLCLGSSLKVLRRYPRLWRMERPPRDRPRLFIVNLQWTPKDAAAELKINARCDAVLRQLARRLRLRVPRYRRAADPLLAHATPLAPAELHTAAPPPPPRPSPASSDRSAYTTASPASSDDSDADDALPLRRLQERLRLGAPPPPPHCEPPFAPLYQAPLTPKCEAPLTPKYETPLTLKYEAACAPKCEVPLTPKCEAPSAPKFREQLTLTYEESFSLKHEEPPTPETRPSAPLENGICSATPDLELRSFQVSMITGAATILLRAQHAPAPAPGPAPAATPALAPPPPPPRSPAPAPAPNGRPPAAKRSEDEGGGAAARLRRLLRHGPPPQPQPQLPPDDDKTDSLARRAAAAIFARAVLLCRAQLYPGLHTIIAPPPAPRARAPAPPPRARPRECAWCARHRGSRRCLWYPRLDPLAPGRVWRRARGRRYLCTCCPRDEGGAGGARGRGRRQRDDATEGRLVRQGLPQGPPPPPVARAGRPAPRAGRRLTRPGRVYCEY